jgi:regulator of protease activity HflC (stomatin/prohibitin superfamily)
MELNGSSVPDKNGSPMKVSAVITYKVIDPAASLFNVRNMESYVKDQGLEVLKRVLSRFPYKGVKPGEPSLLEDTDIIGNQNVK